MNKVQVKPISRKAKNRFSNLMNNDPTCIVEQFRDGMMFLTSQSNKGQHFWVSVDNDPHWMLE